MSLYQQFNDVRKKLKINNGQAAKLLGISRRTLTNYSQKDVYPPPVVSGMKVFVSIGKEMYNQQKTDLDEEQIKVLVKRMMHNTGVREVAGMKRTLYEFLMLNFSELKKGIPSRITHTPSDRTITVLAKTSLHRSNDKEEDDDEMALNIKMELSLYNRHSVIQDSSELKNKLLSGEGDLPEPMICVGPPERNYFTAILGQKRVGLPHSVISKYFNKRRPGIDITICKVSGKAMYIVFASRDELKEEAARLIVDMIVDRVLDLKPSCSDHGKPLPPLQRAR